MEFEPRGAVRCLDCLGKLAEERQIFDKRRSDSQFRKGVPTAHDQVAGGCIPGRRKWCAFHFCRQLGADILGVDRDLVDPPHRVQHRQSAEYLLVRLLLFSFAPAPGHGGCSKQGAQRRAVQVLDAEIDNYTVREKASLDQRRRKLQSVLPNGETERCYVAVKTTCPCRKFDPRQRGKRFTGIVTHA